MYNKLAYKICYRKGNATVSINVLENNPNLPPHKNKPETKHLQGSSQFLYSTC